MIDAKITQYYPRCYLINVSGVCSAKLVSYGDWLFLHSFHTHEDDQRKGYGSQLLALCKRISRRLNKPLQLTASPFYNRSYSIIPLIGYYSKRGFVPIGEFDGYEQRMEYRGK